MFKINYNTGTNYVRWVVRQYQQAAARHVFWSGILTVAGLIVPVLFIFLLIENHLLRAMSFRVDLTFNLTWKSFKRQLENYISVGQLLDAAGYCSVLKSCYKPDDGCTSVRCGPKP
jgi:hypothetical protein